jgi:hypothetical protein
VMATTYQSNTLSEFDPFFGGDLKGHSLVQALFEGQDYSVRVAPNKAALLGELMKADNYNDFQKNRDVATNITQSPEDVHQDVTDLVVTTALYHRQIDMSSGIGQKVSDFVGLFNEALADYLNKTVATREEPPTVNSSVEQYVTPPPAARTNNLVYGLRTGVDTYGTYLLTVLADYVTNIFSQPGTNIGNAGSAGQTLDQILDTVVTYNATADDHTLLSKVLRYARPSPPGGPPNQNVLATMGLLPTGILDTPGLFAIVRASLTNIAGQMLADVQAGRVKNRDLVNNMAIARSFVSNRTKYLNSINNTIRTDVMNILQPNVRLANIDHTTIGNSPEAKAFFTKVYANWRDMSTDAREFYLQNVAIFAKSGYTSVLTSQQRTQPMQLDWIRLTNEEIDNLFTAGKVLTTTDEANLRVNLMKDLNGAGEVLFQTNLPDVPTGANVWYTTSGKTLTVLQNMPTDFLRKLYKSIYNDRNPMVQVGTARTFPLTNTPFVSAIGPNGANVTLTIETDIAKRPLKEFNHDLKKFISAVISSATKNIRQNSQPSVQPTQFDQKTSLDKYSFLAVDMAYGHEWYYDSQKKQYWRSDENGQKVYYDNDKASDARTCYATYLGKKDQSGKSCERVMQCILSGDSKSLGRCLDVIKDDNLWTVANDDVRNVGPDKIKLVLTKFGVWGVTETDTKGVKIKVPVAFDTWMADFVEKQPDKKVRETIKNNQPLLTYIKALISICRANPSILNENVTEVVTRENIPPYMRNLSMRRYTVPSFSKKSKYEVFAQSLRSAVTPRVVNNDLWNPIISGSMPNVAFFSPYAQQSFGLANRMVGGGFGVVNPSLISSGISTMNLDRQTGMLRNGSSNIFNSLFQSITNALSDVGLQMHENDAASIKEAVTHIEKYEDQLARLCIMLNNLVTLARYYGVSLENVDKENLTTMKKLDEIQNWNDVSKFVRSYVRDIVKNMSTNMSIQQATTYELMGRVLPRYADDCAEKSSGTAQPTADRQPLW